MTSINKFYNNVNSILKTGFVIEPELSTSECMKIAKNINLILNSGHSPYVGHLNADGKTIHIETTYFDPVLSVEVTKNSIFFIPLIDSDWHGAFFEVLKIVFLWEKNNIKIEEEKNKKEEIPDFEWI